VTRLLKIVIIMDNNPLAGSDAVAVPTGAQQQRRQLAIWFQLLSAFEISPGKIYRQTSCYRPPVSSLPV